MAFIACCFSLFAFVSRADSFPSVNNGVLTLNIEEGATIVFTDPLPAEATSIIKKGGGTATLSAASTSYTGPIDIQKGTLKLTDRYAAGKGSKITVSGDEATLFLNFDNPEGDRQDRVFFHGHDLTIRGKGVGEQGAFRFEAPTTWACDSALDTLTLSDDAYIAIVTRFGVANKIKLDGHSLTRVGDANGPWIFYKGNCEIDGGIISNTVGQVTIQNVPVFLNPAETTLAVTGGGLMFWNSQPDLPCRLVSNVNIWEDAYDGPGNNVISGPIEFIGDHDYEVRGGHQMEFRGEMTASGKFTKQGSGNLYLDGPFEGKDFYIREGALICSSNVTRKVEGLVLNESRPRLDLRGGTVNGGWVRVANGWSIASVLQSGGDFIARGDTYVGEVNPSYGAWMMSAGKATFTDLLHISSLSGSEGVIWQTGGEIKAGKNFLIGCEGRGFVGVFNGAVNDSRVSWYGSGPTLQLGYSSGGYGAVAVTGEGSVLTTESVVMGCTNNVFISTNIIVVADGGTLKARRFYRRGDVSSESLNEVYFDGGVIYPTFGWGWTHHGGNEFQYAADYWVLGPKGMIVDTSELEGENYVEGDQNYYSEWSHKLSDLSGRGIATIELPLNNEEFSAQNYSGPAFVDIVGPKGSHGAMAMAEVDPQANKLTRVIVFSPGSGYDETTKVYVRSAALDGKRFECSYTLTGKRAGGKLIKRGKQQLDLYAANTYTGGTIVEGGKLVMINEKSFPENTPLKVMTGGEFSNNLHPITVSVLGGVGGKITDCAGTMKVTEALEITAAELFSSTEPLFFAGTINFADGVEIRITDPENLPKFKNENRRKFLTAEGGFEGKIPEVTMVVGGRLWSVDCVGNSLTLGPDRSSKIIIR